MLYRCWDDQWSEIDIEAASAEEAAQEYVDTGNWGCEVDDDGKEHPRRSTFWVDVYLVLESERLRNEQREVQLDRHELDSYACVTVTIDPEEPKCEGQNHVWTYHALWGSGGGVLYATKCTRCGWTRRNDTWAQRPDTGEQGLESIEYVYDEILRSAKTMDEKSLTDEF